MPFNDITDRSNPGGGALVPPEQATGIIKMAEQQSAALSLLKHVPILTNQKTFPVLSSQPSAFWLDGTDTALIETSHLAWKGVEMKVGDVAVIVPFPRRLASDISASGINLTEEIKPAITQAVAKAIDAAIFFGISAPAVWATESNMFTRATNAGNIVEIGETAAKGGLHADVLKTLKTLTADGFTPDSCIGRPTFQFDLMNARDTTGQPLFLPQELSNGKNGLGGRLLGRPVHFSTHGVFPADAAGAPQLMFFDSTKHLIGVREDINFDIFTEGIIQDNTGLTMFNLMQQDIIAVRMIMRVGYASTNPVTMAEPTEANRYPAAALVTAAA